jgi:hypothetical protein
VSAVGLVSLIYQGVLLSKALDLKADWKASLTFANKNQMIYTLAEDVANEVALRFSRYSSNAALQKCITAQPSPCNEANFYDMAMFAPIEQQSYQGGVWPDPPTGSLLLAGGLTTNVVLFRETGQRCPMPNLTTANEFCPLQAVIEFRPLCGGTKDTPEYLGLADSSCPGPALGFDIRVGVARYMNGVLVYHRNTDPGGDARIFRFTSSLFRN